MTNDSIQQLLILCHRMHKEGVTPSVGMLRSKAPFKVSVTEAIETIKRFNAGTSKNTQNTVPESSKENDLSKRVLLLEQEVEVLKQTLQSVVKQLAN